MVKDVMKVVWDEEARQQIRSIYEYIKLDSPRSASKVRNDR
jgi:plasmid stabilization system protein ParE